MTMDDKKRAPTGSLFQSTLLFVPGVFAGAAGPGAAARKTNATYARLSPGRLRRYYVPRARAAPPKASSVGIDDRQVLDIDLAVAAFDVVCIAHAHDIA